MRKTGERPAKEGNACVPPPESLALRSPEPPVARSNFALDPEPCSLRERADRPRKTGVFRAPSEDLAAPPPPLIFGRYGRTAACVLAEGADADPRNADRLGVICLRRGRGARRRRPAVR